MHIPHVSPAMIGLCGGSNSRDNAMHQFKHQCERLNRNNNIPSHGRRHTLR